MLCAHFPGPPVFFSQGWCRQRCLGSPGETLAWVQAGQLRQEAVEQTLPLKGCPITTDSYDLFIFPRTGSSYEELKHLVS